MKKITILNGITDDKFLDFEKQLDAFATDRSAVDRLEEVKIECFTLRKMNIKYCTGCWSCWLKTPGECPLKDEMPKILRSVIHSDLTVFVSPVIMGFVSKHIKKAGDRLIPLVHPYIDISEKECHHISRYDKYPKLGLMLIEEQSNDARGNVGIITDIYKRNALNFKSKLAFSIVSNGSVEVLENEINRI